MLLHVCFLPALRCEEGMRWNQPVFFFLFFFYYYGVFQVVGGGGDRVNRRRMESDHRCLRRALYMAKPSTANTVAPTLALSQKVEFFRSAWAMCGYMAMVVSLV